MDEQLQTLIDGINRWRDRGIQDYWVQVDYIGSALNRMGNHIMTFTQGKLWHQWHDEWREIEKGSDFWLFCVPGTFAWVRDMITKVLPSGENAADAVEIRLNDQFGYVEYLRVKMPQRDAANFTFEVKAFGEGPHPDFTQ